MSDYYIIDAMYASFTGCPNVSGREQKEIEDR